jgi:hypothetical protein
MRCIHISDSAVCSVKLQSSESLNAKPFPRAKANPANPGRSSLLHNFN